MTQAEIVERYLEEAASCESRALAHEAYSKVPGIGFFARVAHQRAAEIVREEAAEYLAKALDAEKEAPRV